MTQNNIYMENENLEITVNVLPEAEDTVKNAATSSAVNAALAAESVSTASSLVNSISSIKTEVEVFVAQALEGLHDLYSDISTGIYSLKNTIIQEIQQIGEYITTRIVEYVNEAKGYAKAAQEIVDFHVSTEHLNQSKALETGGISDDGLVFASVDNYAHSTYDSTKFTVTGSPVITSEGIVSGFSGSNYLTIPEAKLLSATEWEIIIPVTFSDISSTQYLLSKYGVEQAITIGLWQNDYIFLWLATGQYLNSTFRPQANIKYYIKVSYKNGTASIDVSTDGNNYSNYGTASLTVGAYVNPDTIGMGYNNSRYLRGSIDLKQFSITVDGVPVFSGNKTGIDTIKPNDYTVVGSPTISEDGIISGFSGSNYLNIINAISSLTTAHKFDVTCKTVGVSTQQTIFAFGQTVGTSSDNHSRLILINSKFAYRIVMNGELVSVSGTSNVAENTDYIVECGQYSNGTMFLRYKKIGDTAWIEDKTAIGTLVNYTDIILARLGQSVHVTTEAFLGSIDLNAFKIYVNGNLVYQPCLKIPYTESKTGSKIVDSIYRDRVNDMYNQFGYAPYYTLSDSDFTLPCGEIYGMIEKLRNQIEALNT